MTIPRLELRATLLAAKLLGTVATGLDVPSDRHFLWSDSSTVVDWLGSDKPVSNSLVDNYIEHIQDLTSRKAWRYVPTGENPANIATRGASPIELQRNLLWWHGPPWLAFPSDSWLAPLDQRKPSTVSTDYEKSLSSYRLFNYTGSALRAL
ncbi:uncharacterized protein LOC106642714 [Copidosoma floridanum]|uniref:uncharacterized protein LOC106642714 n=1 Tax=Copidosoma floridanum TaxID=29053 RepID=UPI0006C9813B|nr:uncharacterized protein LOC106642714 [Copidosoma floridanum]